MHHVQPERAAKWKNLAVSRVKGSSAALDVTLKTIRQTAS